MGKGVFITCDQRELIYRQVHVFGRSAAQIHEECFPGHILETIQRHVARINRLFTPKEISEYLAGPLRRGGGSDFANHHNIMSHGESADFRTLCNP